MLFMYVNNFSYFKIYYIIFFLIHQTVSRHPFFLCWTTWSEDLLVPSSWSEAGGFSDSVFLAFNGVEDMYPNILKLVGWSCFFFWKQVGWSCFLHCLQNSVKNTCNSEPGRRAWGLGCLPFLSQTVWKTIFDAVFFMSQPLDIPGFV